MPHTDQDSHFGAYSSGFPAIRSLLLASEGPADEFMVVANVDFHFVKSLFHVRAALTASRAGEE
jgi:hypothetical protein